VNGIIEFWKSSYRSDRVAFVYELLSFVFTVAASASLALTADAPDMRIVYPGFFIGSVFGVLGYYRRKLAWPMMLTSWFIFVNILGFGVAMRWW
jgi:hypothetical protein